MKPPVWRLLAIGLAAMSLLHPRDARSEPVRVAVEAPAHIALVRSPEATRRPQGAERVVLTVSGYEPSSAGPVQIVVSVGCGSTERLIGSFAVLPATGFTADDKQRRQNFALALPAECGRADRLTVRLVPSRGDGSGAHADIAVSTIE